MSVTAVKNSALLDISRVPFTAAYAEVAQTVRDAGLMRRRTGSYAILAAGLGLASVGLLVGFIMIGDSWFQLLIALGAGLVFSQWGFLGHEASHRQVMNTGPGNDRVGRVISTLIVGLSYSWWMNKHNRHHANPNTLRKDPDIDPDTIVFHEEAAAVRTGFKRWLTAHQGYLFFPLLTLEGVNLHAKAFQHLVTEPNVKGRWFELSVLAVRWTLYLGVLFWALPIGMAFAFLAVQLAVFGLWLGASFAPNHKGMPIIAEDAKVDFFTKQVLTSRNISGWYATAIMGGLNYQVEHHLFPSMPRFNLAKTREIVIEFCEARDVLYTETTLADSYKRVVNYLNDVGLAARDPFNCPVAEGYGR